MLQHTERTPIFQTKTWIDEEEPRELQRVVVSKFKKMPRIIARKQQVLDEGPARYHVIEPVYIDPRCEPVFWFSYSCATTPRSCRRVYPPSRSRPEDSSARFTCSPVTRTARTSASLMRISR